MLTPERKSYCKKVEHTKDYILWWALPLLLLLISVIVSYLKADVIIDDMAIVIFAVVNIGVLYYCNWCVLKYRDIVALILCFVFLVPTLIISAADTYFVLLFPVTTTLPLFCMFGVFKMIIRYMDR